jgi:hypothetical protein
LKSAKPSSSKSKKDDDTFALNLRGSAKVASKKSDKVASQCVTTEQYSASNIDDALTLLTGIQQTENAPSNSEIDKHPERRAKAAFKAYEEIQLPILKEEHPGLRLSQLKELLFKNWQKAPENPFNQVHATYNAKASVIQEYSNKEVEKNLDRLRIDQD